MAGGRPEANIDWSLIENLCKIQCTQDEIASVLGHCVDTIDKHCKLTHDMSFSDFFKLKRTGGLASLRRNQWKMAETIPTMAIWLGKQYLKQADKNEFSADDKGISINYNVIKKD